MEAYLAVAMERDMAPLEARLRTLRQQVERNPDLTAQQKQRLFDKMASALDFAPSMHASEAAKAAVRPHMRELEPLFQP